MDDPLLQQLSAAKSPEDKAAVVAEMLFSRLPEETSVVAHQCIILHWFDEAIIEAFFQDIPNKETKPRDIYERLKHLPFVEILPWGLAFNHLTRESLLRRYTKTQPELLRTAAHLAAPAFRMHGRRDKRAAAEAFYCYTVAGDTTLALGLLEEQLTDAASRGDWEYIAGLFRLQDEAEQMPFVSPLRLPNEYTRIRLRAYQVLINPIPRIETVPDQPRATAYPFEYAGVGHEVEETAPHHGMKVPFPTVNLPKNTLSIALRHWIWRGLAFFWGVILLTLFLNIFANFLNLGEILSWISQNLLIALPLGFGFIALTVLEGLWDSKNPSVEPNNPPPQRRIKWVLQYGAIVGLLVIALASLLVPASFTATAITLVPLGIIALILLLILLAIRVISLVLHLSPKNVTSQPRRFLMSRREFLLFLYSSATVGVGIVLAFLSVRLSALLTLLSPGKQPVIVTVVYSTEKSDWLIAATRTFNQAHQGSIQVELVDERGSLDVVNRIVNGPSQPTAWSPASSLELHLLSNKWRQQYTDRPDIIDYTGDLAPQSLVHSPLVFAIWQSRATVLSNSLYKVIDWPSIHALLSLRKWSMIGGDERWGEVKFGQTQPDLSNSGLLTITQMAYSFFNKQSDLTPEDIANPLFQKYFKEIEDQVWCFGPSSGTFMDTVLQLGPTEFDIITTYENLVLSKELEAIGHWEPLLMYYSSLNIISDHPFAILQGDWVSLVQKNAAQKFLAFLLNEDQQRRALTFGFRSYNGKVPITDPIPGNRFRGQPSFIQNQIRSEEDLKPLAQPPSGEVIDAQVSLWQAQQYTRDC